MTSWRDLLRPGDWVLMLFGLAGVIALFVFLWERGHPERAVVRLDGRIVAEFSLTTKRRYVVQGRLGETVIEIAPGRARILADAGPRQYCVQQGWLTRPNAVALCAPSHVSLALVGGLQSHDSLNY